MRWITILLVTKKILKRTLAVYWKSWQKRRITKMSILDQEIIIPKTPQRIGTKIYRVMSWKEFSICIKTITKHSTIRYPNGYWKKYLLVPWTLLRRIIKLQGLHDLLSLRNSFWLRLRNCSLSKSSYIFSVPRTWSLHALERSKDWRAIIWGPNRPDASETDRVDWLLPVEPWTYRLLLLYNNKNI